MPDVIASLNLSKLSDLFQTGGFRSEIVEWNDGRQVLRSAAAGVTFFAVPGNGAEDGFADLTFFTSFRVEGWAVGDLPNIWNSGRRFTRVHTRENMLNFEMDVVLAGGVTDGYVIFSINMWNQLLNEFINAVREWGSQASKPLETVN